MIALLLVLGTGVTGWSVVSSTPLTGTRGIYPTKAGIFVHRVEGPQERAELRGRDLSLKLTIPLPQGVQILGTDRSDGLVFTEWNPFQVVNEDGRRAGWTAPGRIRRVEEPWSLMEFGSRCLVANGSDEKYIVDDIFGWDAVGIYPETGRLAVVRTRKGVTELSVYDDGGDRLFKHPLSNLAQGAYFGGFPYVSLSFLHERTVLTFLLNKGPAASELPLLEGDRKAMRLSFLLCTIDMASGAVVPLPSCAAKSSATLSCL